MCHGMEHNGVHAQAPPFFLTLRICILYSHREMCVECLRNIIDTFRSSVQRLQGLHNNFVWITLHFCDRRVWFFYSFFFCFSFCARVFLYILYAFLFWFSEFKLPHFMIHVYVMHCDVEGRPIEKYDVHECMEVVLAWDMFLSDLVFGILE